MKKLLIALALSTAACTPGIDILGAPAPLQKTVIDEKGLLAAWSDFVVALTAVDGLIVAKVIVPGSPRALQIKGYLKTAQNGLNAATAAQKAGNASSYFAALNEAQTALRLASTTLRGN